MASAISEEVEKVWTCRLLSWTEKGKARGIEARWGAKPLFFGRYVELKGTISVEKLPLLAISDMEKRIDREHRFNIWASRGGREFEKEDWMDAYSGQRLINFLEVEFVVKEADIFFDDLIFSIGNVGGGSNVRLAKLIFVAADETQANLFDGLSLQQRYEQGIIFLRVLTDASRNVTGLELSTVWRVSGKGDPNTRPEYFFDVGLQYRYEGEGQTIGELLEGGARPQEVTTYRLLGRSRELDSGPIELECNLAFLYWNRIQKKHMGVPEGVEVRVIDEDIKWDDVIGRGRIIGNEGKVHIISINKDEGNPDVFFEVLTNSRFIELETNRLVTADERDSSKHYLPLPRKWSSRGKYRGYFDDFEGTRIGSTSLPLTFDITSVSPEEPGPFAVGRTTYTAPSFTIKPGQDGLEGWRRNVEVTMEALVRYPADKGRENELSTRRSKYPLVILAHGSHDAIARKRDSDGYFVDRDDPKQVIKDAKGLAAEFKNYEGLEYLADHLASHGFIAVSINLNGKFWADEKSFYAQVAHIGYRDGERVKPKIKSCKPYIEDQMGIAHRGLAVLRHIKELRFMNSSSSLFQNKIDLDNIALIGHSRGGEGVVSAYDQNKLLPPADQANIIAVVSIAPTDVRHITIDIPYLVLIGSDDGDVVYAEGLRLYDRACPPKQMIWIVGGIHNYFSSNWFWQDEVPDKPSVTRAQHQDIAKGYCNAFLQQYVNNPEFQKTANGADGIRPLFTGERKLKALRGKGVKLHFASQHPGALIVDNFENKRPHKRKNSLGESVTVTDIDETRFEELDLHRYIYETSHKEGSLCTIDQSSLNWNHETHGLRLEWSVNTARYTTALGNRSVLDFKALSFRVGQDNEVGTPQNFRVRLTDSNGENAMLKVSDFGEIPSLRKKKLFPIQGGKWWKDSKTGRPLDDSRATVLMSVLGGIRLPLDKFKAANPAINLDALSSITFEFSEKSAGRLVFDDIEFST